MTLRCVTTAGLGLVLVAGGLALGHRPALAGEDQIVAKESREIDGVSYTFEKRLMKDGQIRSVVFDDQGQAIAEHEMPRATKTLVEARLQEKLDLMDRRGDTGELITVNIALNFPDEIASEAPESGEAEIVRGVVKRTVINGLERSPDDLESLDNGKLFVRGEASLKRQTDLRDRLEAWSGTHDLKIRAAIAGSVEHSRSSITLELTRDELQKLVRSNDSRIGGIELHEPSEDDITQAMADTSITGSALPYSSTRGNGIGIFMTESGCANESRITNYDRLSGSETNHSRNVGAIIRAVSPSSFLYCRGGAVLPTNVDLHAALYNAIFGFNLFPVLNPPIRIVTRSNSSNDSTSYNTLDRDWDDFVYNNAISTFNSGGNTGTGTGNVRSPGKGLNIATVGNYNDATDSIVGSSPFNDPNTGNQKPEIVAPGANITAGGFTYTGTSQATPHAAAFAADMMSSSTYLKGKPYLVKAKMLAGATDGIGGGSNKVGLGGIDFASAHWSGHAFWWEGNNGSFTSFAQTDGGSSSTYVEKRVYISAFWDKARIVVAWLNRGSYTYSHRNDAHPIGMDLDLRIYDPNGAYKGGSFSWDNPYEKVEFSPTVSGYYTIKINRYANRDTGLNLRMGAYVNYYNN